MDDTVILRHHAIMCQSEIGSILRQHIHLLLRYRVFNGFILIMCRCIMIRHTEYLLGAETLQSSFAHALESLWRGHLMAIEPVDIQLRGTILDLLDHMFVPYLVE